MSNLDFKVKVNVTDNIISMGLVLLFWYLYQNGHIPFEPFELPFSLGAWGVAPMIAMTIFCMTQLFLLSWLSGKSGVMAVKTGESQMAPFLVLYTVITVILTLICWALPMINSLDAGLIAMSGYLILGFGMGVEAGFWRTLAYIVPYGMIALAFLGFTMV